VAGNRAKDLARAKATVDIVRTGTDGSDGTVNSPSPVLPE
jgi:hypothetical protein